MLPSLNSIDSSQISSSSSSSSPSPFSYSHFSNKKTMEEVWKDINITSLPNTPLIQTHNHNIINNTCYNNNNNNNNNHIVHHPRPTTNFNGMILQDFLNCNNQSISTVDSNHLDGPTITHNKLSTEFPQIFETTNNNIINSNDNCEIMQGNSAFDSFGIRDGIVSKKRFCEDNNVLSSENLNVDRRNKRMLKNRESAARSRARKQAYISELELELAHLAAENARLRKQQQQLLEAPSTQLPKKKGLQRTLTAPF